MDNLTKHDLDYRELKEDTEGGCEECGGEGYYTVANGPDDFDKVKCICRIEVDPT